MEPISPTTSCNCLLCVLFIWNCIILGNAQTSSSASRQTNAAHTCSSNDRHTNLCTLSGYQYKIPTAELQCQYHLPVPHTIQLALTMTVPFSQRLTALESAFNKKLIVTGACANIPHKQRANIFIAKFANKTVTTRNRACSHH